jgi:flagellar basal-body rod modification protein FlgD
MGVISAISTDTSSTTESTSSSSTLDKDDFLQLLVTKLTNQDPLDPLDDEAFTAELAQFSSLEQLQNISTALETSLQYDYLQMQTINNTMATSLIGKEVNATYDSVYLSSDNRPLIAYTLTDTAESVKVEIMDSDGTVVRTLYEEDVPAGNASVTWDGEDNNGNRLAAGSYTISISGTDADGNAITPSTYVEGIVDGIVYRDGSAYLQIEGLEIPLSAVTSISNSES